MGIMGNTTGAALTVNSNYGSKNPSCASRSKLKVPVGAITYTNITQAAGTSVAAWIDFEGLPTNTIDNVVLDGVFLKQTSGGSQAKCLLVKGQYRECKACAVCAGLSPMLDQQ